MARLDMALNMALNMNDAVAEVESIIKFTFSDPTLLWEALQAPGSGVLRIGNRPVSYDGNKRLAMIGNAWLRVVILMDWGTEIRARAEADARLKVATKANLQYLCQVHGLERFINLNPGELGFPAPRTMSDTMEAILGAVAQEGGYEAVRSVMMTLGLLST